MSLLRQVCAGMKKKKRDAASLAVLVFLAVMLLAAGIAVQSSIKHFYYESNERLHAPHYSASIPNNLYKESYLEYLQNDSRVSETELRESAIMYGATYEVNGGEEFLYSNFYSVEDNASIGAFAVIEEAESVVQNGIYVPYFFKNNGYSIGDTVRFEYNNEVFSYQVAGYFETTWFGTSVSSMVTFYLPEQAYQTLYQQIGGGKFLSARLYDYRQAEALKQDFKADTGLLVQAAGRDVTTFDGDIMEMQSISVMFPSITAGILMAFAVIILVIILLVIRFRVYSHMEDNMKNIGVMEALGYTSRQIRWMLMLEYLLIAAAGAVPGILASYGLIQLMGGFISGFIGVSWMVKFYPLINLLCVVLVGAMVAVTTFVYSRKIRRLTPVTALRGGLESHNFRQNYFSFSGSRFPLQFQLALKGMAANIRQYLMVSIILVGVTAATAYAMMLYNNMSGNNSAVYKAIGMEKSNVTVKLAAHQDVDLFAGEMMEMAEVRSVSTYYSATSEVEGRSEITYVSDDFSKIETVQVYQGTFPQHDNEIVISGLMAKSMNKTVGDTVQASYLGVSAEYLICGLTQTMNNLGRVALFNLEGMQRINPSFYIREVNIYLEDGYDTKDFIKKLEREYTVLSPEQEKDTSAMNPEQRARQRAEERITKLLSMYGVDSADYALSVNGEVVFFGSSMAYRIEKIDNMELFIETSVSSFVTMVAMLVLGVLVATLFIVGLILVLVIRYMLLRRRHEFGVMKALGYTSSQIRMQIALGFVPVSLTGIAAGCMVAAVTLNPVLNVLLAPIGVSNLSFHSNPLLLGGLLAGVVLYVFLVAFISSRKVKAITPYELFVD